MSNISLEEKRKIALAAITEAFSYIGREPHPKSVMKILNKLHPEPKPQRREVVDIDGAVWRVVEDFAKLGDDDPPFEFFSKVNLSWCRAATSSIRVSLSRVRLWADLLKHPYEEVPNASAGLTQALPADAVAISHDARDYPEDRRITHRCTECKNYFNGAMHRIICKVCATADEVRYQKGG